MKNATMLWLNRSKFALNTSYVEGKRMMRSTQTDGAFTINGWCVLGEHTIRFLLITSSP